MQRQVAIGAVVGFALTVIFLSVCEVRMSKPAPEAPDAAVASAPAPVAAPKVEALPDVPRKQLERAEPMMVRPLRPGLRRGLVLERLNPADGGN